MQWLCGMAVALSLLRRPPHRGPLARGPRAFAALAVGLFLLAAAELLGAWLTGVAGIAWLPAQLRTQRWQAVLLLAISVAGWVALLVAAMWKELLGMRLRRRTTAAELKRRTE
ncbi:MAG TPA: hypothetical protein VFS05_00900, partial [Gemmatimonadaceae bacterium]|nr:hypothetical protein [Gemmatimonadaceae bacterium]